MTEPPAAIEAYANRLFVLILQHPQEKDRELGSAGLALRHVANGRLAIGLSWRSLSAALGRSADPRRWGVLYLGSKRLRTSGTVGIVDRHGDLDPDPQGAIAALEGVILLDGSWSQAKALWWRNPWLSRLKRILLDTGSPSRYGRLRREPRDDGLATIEAAAHLLSVAEGDPAIEMRMLASFEALLALYRARRSGGSQEPGCDS